MAIFLTLSIKASATKFFFLRIPWAILVKWEKFSPSFRFTFFESSLNYFYICAFAAISAFFNFSSSNSFCFSNLNSMSSFIVSQSFSVLIGIRESRNYFIISFSGSTCYSEWSLSESFSMISATFCPLISLSFPTLNSISPISPMAL